jgi:hypothetical protein
MIDEATLLAGLPVGLRDPLLNSFREIASNYVEHRWESSELNGGKFSEVVYTIVEGALSGTFANTPSKPPNMVNACRALEGAPGSSSRVGDRSLRVLIPRILPALYEIRNNRGVGHVGGDVDPNFLDASAVYSMSSWTLAELVRIFHQTSTREAQEAVDALMERKHLLIWEVDQIRRVLDPDMDKKSQALLLLHQKPAWVSISDLFTWVEYSTVSNFRSQVIEPFHGKRLLEYDKANGRVRISPLGIKKVERDLLKSRV